MRNAQNNNENRGESELAHIRNSFKQVIKETLNATNKDIDCPICTRRFKHGDRAETLACHANHILHEKCYADFAKSWQEKG